jgi:hypothetical protein
MEEAREEGQATRAAPSGFAGSLGNILHQKSGHPILDDFSARVGDPQSTSFVNPFLIDLAPCLKTEALAMRPPKLWPALSMRG